MSEETKVIKTIRVFEKEIISKDIVKHLLEVYKKKEIYFQVFEGWWSDYDTRVFSGYFKREFGCTENEKILILL